MEDDGSNCGYIDEKTAIWQTLRIWSKNGKIFAINPQSGRKDGISIEGFIVLKKYPNTHFSDTEMKFWRQIIDTIAVE
jgi:hypothetical protein